MTVVSSFDLIPFFSWRKRIVNVSASGATLCEADNSRVTLIIGPDSSPSAVTIFPEGLITNGGLTLDAPRLPWTLTFRDHGILPTLQWSARVGAGSNAVGVLEVFYRPRQAKSAGEVEGLPPESL
jgi:hypothetical protein